MLLMNVLLHKVGKRNRCSKKKTIAGKFVGKEYGVEGEEGRSGPSLELPSVAAHSFILSRSYPQYKCLHR